MGYSIRHLPEKNIVALHVSGVIDNPKPLRAAVRELVELASTHNCDKFIIDYTQAGPNFTTVDLYESANLLLDLGFKYTDKLATILKEETFLEDRNRIEFFETMAQNRGWRNLRLFANGDAALQWLEGGD